MGKPTTEKSPLIIAHRGASGYLPEHTLPAYALAYGLGADYVEPDLVLTRDGVFICLHDIHLDLTTNVAELFADRAREDGHWYAADFTFEEIRRLRVHERTENRFPRDLRLGLQIPSFREMVHLIQGLNTTSGRRVGVYPELKAPSWHRGQGLPMEEAFLRELADLGYTTPDDPVFVQSFESDSLERLRRLGSELKHVFLLGDGGREWLTPGDLRRVATFADGIGPAKPLLLENPSIVKWAHDAGLVVHPYTFRVDATPEEYGSHEEELEHFVDELGVDGLFTDFTDRAVQWRISRGR